MKDFRNASPWSQSVSEVVSSLFGISEVSFFLHQCCQPKFLSLCLYTFQALARPAAPTQACFNSVKRRQLERLQKRSDWFLSPPSGLRSSGLIHLNPTSSSASSSNPNPGNQQFLSLWFYHDSVTICLWLYDYSSCLLSALLLLLLLVLYWIQFQLIPDWLFYNMPR